MDPLAKGDPTSYDENALQIPEADYKVPAPGLPPSPAIVSSPPICEKPHYITSHVLHGHKKSIYSVKFSPDGRFLASCGEEHIIKIWSTATGELVRNLAEDSGPVYDGAWLSDGVYLASAPAHLIGTIRIWNVSTGMTHKMLNGRPTQVLSCLSYNHYSNLLVSGGSDGDLRIWDISRGTYRVIHAHMSPVKSVDFSRTAKRIISCSIHGQVRLWDTSTGTCWQDLEQLGHRVQFSPNSKYFISLSPANPIQLWECKTFQCLRTYVGHQDRDFSNPMCFGGTGGKWIVAGGKDHKIYIWDVQTTNIVQVLDGHTDVVTAIATHPRKNMIATGSGDAYLTIRLWVDQKAQVGDVT